MLDELDMSREAEQFGIVRRRGQGLISLSLQLSV